MVYRGEGRKGGLGWRSRQSGSKRWLCCCWPGGTGTQTELRAAWSPGAFSYTCQRGFLLGTWLSNSSLWFVSEALVVTSFVVSLQTEDRFFTCHVLCGCGAVRTGWPIPIPRRRDGTPPPLSPEHHAVVHARPPLPALHPQTHPVDIQGPAIRGHATLDKAATRSHWDGPSVGWSHLDIFPLGYGPTWIPSHSRASSDLRGMSQWESAPPRLLQSSFLDDQGRPGAHQSGSLPFSPEMRFSLGERK